MGRTLARPLASKRFRPEGIPVPLTSDLRATHTPTQLAQLAFSLFSIYMVIRRFTEARRKVKMYRATGVSPISSEA